MLSVQSPLQLTMPNDAGHDDGHAAWIAWRTQTNLPTPPSSEPPRRLGTTTSKEHFIVDRASHRYAGMEDGGHQQHLTLPPIAHIDRHWPNSSPLTPPDDDMHASPSIWRNAKPGPSRPHSPMTANTSPLLASPSPSPTDDDERYAEECDMMDGQFKTENELRDQEWDWRQIREGYIEGQPGLDQDAGSSDHTRQSSSAVDWITNPAQRSAHFIAEKTCEMVCYLWFSSSLGPRAAAASRARRERERSQRKRPRDTSSQPHSPPFASRPLSNASTAALQFCASPEFVAFMGKLLATTQVSQSVIVLSLHYIFRLKERNDFTLGKPGSEFRVAVCALMLANKFVDDNTYTNKTWSEVSAIPLEELNKMEREFLLGIGFRLFVDAQTYDAWLNLLKGLVLTKEREHNRWRERRRARVIVPRIRIPDSGEYTQREQQQQQERARSTSPHHSRSYAYAPAYPFTFSVPSASTTQLQAISQPYNQSQSSQTSPNCPISSKRSATDAFSPTSATFAGAARSVKRPTGLALDIPAALASASSLHAQANISSDSRQEWEKAGSVSAHPAFTYADSLRGMERMSLATPVEQQTASNMREEERVAECGRQREEQTLAAPYRGVDAARRAPPPHLYFYTLASSPLRFPYVESACADASAQTSAPYSGNVSLPEELPSMKEDANKLPSGAERKTRLRYVDNGYDYGARDYGYLSTQGQSRNQADYKQSAPPASCTTLPSVTKLNGYTHPQHVQQSSSQPAQQHLPPLALALSMPLAPARSQTSQTQSASASPLPSFASLSAYSVEPKPFQTQPAAQSSSFVAPQIYPTTTAPNYSTPYYQSPAAPVVQNAWSAPPRESVDGVYAPVPRHVLPHSHVFYNQHVQLPPPAAYKSYASPPYTYPSQQQDVRQDVTATGLSAGSAVITHAEYLPKRADFANAGPPGVAHFYPGAEPSYGAGSSQTLSSNGRLPVPGMIQQSQSVTASPEGAYMYGYDYTMRGRRL